MPDLANREARPVAVSLKPDQIGIVVLLPAYNEALSVADTVRAFQEHLPSARIYVYDNNSKDGTAQIAADAGAIVRHEPRQGKGFVVRRMFADIEADVYVMSDADNTYDACAITKMIDRLRADGLDMVVGARAAISDTAYRPAHEFGNWLLTGLVRWIFGNEFSDMLSGYRVFSRRFVKSFPIMSRGFEIETELTIHALELEMPTVEIVTEFKDRAMGSVSKLHTISDGVRILTTIAALLKQERPFHIFGGAAVVLALGSVVIVYPVFDEYLRTGLVPRLPTAVLATGMMLLAYLSFFSGLILDTVTRGRREAKRLRYLQLAGINARQEELAGRPNPCAARFAR
jgi:glycosyltransferase involved in cell wall biosynthesis